MQNAIDVANYFVSLAEPELGEGITHLKLQKLLYYAQGTFLTIHNKKLFEEAIEAWEHGPVVCEVYKAFKKYKNNIIVKRNIELPSFTKKEKEIMNEVYEYFGQFSAWKLRNMTHNESPWLKTERGSEIKPALLKEYFHKIVVEE